ncbi:PA14 domain-containing protein [Streptomyces sp. NBC_01537]|uniref:PA14 domain-containing protein n=1 Tax=Streptomyces sp. NBC_01537 TaxID=2903896 RepID=UPI00386D5E26
MRIHNRPASIAVLSLAVAAAGLVPAATARAASASSCGSNIWHQAFYANTGFKGDPKNTTCDKKIDESYGTGDPLGVSLPVDNFSVRWTVTRNFGSGGPFTFTTAVRDGVRVYLDGKRKISLWKDVTSTQKKTVNVTVPKGKHTIRVDFVAFKGKANISFAYAPRTSASVDKVKPLAPTGLDATYSAGTLKARLTWSRNHEMDLAGYRVYRRLTTGTAWTKVSGTALVTSAGWTDTPPATGAKYVYAVVAVDKAGNTSAKSGTDTVTSTDKTAPAVPTGAGVTYAKETGQAAVSWAANTDADLAGYRVYRRAGTGTTWTKVSGTALLTSLTYTDTPPATGETYSYAVTTVDTSGNESAKSTESSAASADRTPPGVPADVTVTYSDSTGRALVKWSAVTDPGFQTYRVYRRTDTDGDWVQVTPDSPLLTWAQEYDQLPVGVAATYTYTVTALDKSGNESAKSGEASVTLTETSGGPRAVTGLTAEATEYGVELDWDDSTDADLAGYRVSYGRWETDHTGTYFFHQWSSALLSGSHYRLLKLPYGASLTFQVVGVDTDSYTITDTSASMVAVTELDLGSGPYSVPRSGTGAVALSLSAADSGGVFLDWYCSNQSVCDQITGYNVYRYDRATGAYVKLNDEILATAPSSYTDTTAADGTTHFYRVAAVFDDGTESLPAQEYVILPPAE